MIYQKEVKKDINQLVGEAYLMRAYMHFPIWSICTGSPILAAGALETKASSSQTQLLDLEEIPSRNTL